MTGRDTPGDLRLLGRRTAVVVVTALAIAGVVALLVLAAEVLLLVFAGLLFGVLLSSLSDAVVRVSGMRRGVALGLTVSALLTGAVGVGVVAIDFRASRPTGHRATGCGSGVARLVRTAGMGPVAARAR